MEAKFAAWQPYVSCDLPSVGADQLPAGQVCHRLHPGAAVSKHYYTLFMCTGCRRKPSGKQLPGPKFPVPLVGAVVEMVLDPFKFWEQQRKWAPSVLGEAAIPACRPCTPLPAPANVRRKSHTCSACRLSFPGLSCNTLLGKFMVFITDPDSCRTALSVNSPDSLLMAVHPSGKVLPLLAIPPCSSLNTGTNKQPSFS